MVTLIKYGALSGGEKYNVNQMWIDGLSTDSKPTTTVEGMPIPNGSVYTEVDTGKTYMFDKENVVWYEVSLGGGGGFTPTQVQLDAMNSGITAERLQTDENNILSLNSAIYEEKTIDYVYISEIEGITKDSGKSANVNTNGIVITSLSSYDTYYVVFNEDADIYVDTTATPNYLAISYGSNYTEKETISGGYVLKCSNANRVRKSDNNLPTSNSKLHISSGSIVAFTVTANTDCMIYGLPQTYTVINPNFKKAVSPEYCLAQYISGTGIGLSTERLEIYVPANSGYIKYNFVHSVDVTRNANVWRIENAVVCNGYLQKIADYTTSGEWECAVKLKDREDFSGGLAHGDEITEEVTLIIDGEPKDISSITEITPFLTLSIYQRSKIYDPSDSETEIATHGSEHCFDWKGLTLKQDVKWLVSEEVVTAYLAMFPAAKAYTNKIIGNVNYQKKNLPQTIEEQDVTSVTLFSDTISSSSIFSINKYPTGLSSLEHKFYCGDNGGQPYNKCYYVSKSTGTYTTTINEVWNVEVKYSINA